MSKELLDYWSDLVKPLKNSHTNLFMKGIFDMKKKILGIIIETPKSRTPHPPKNRNKESYQCDQIYII